MTSLDESTVEQAALDWFAELGYAVAHGPDLAPGEPAAERDAFSDVVLVGRLRAAIHGLNPAIPADAREEALRKVLRPETPSLSAGDDCNRRCLLASRRKCFSVNAAASARSAIDRGSLPSSIPLRVSRARRQHSAELEAGHSSLLDVGQAHRRVQRRTLRHRRLDRQSAAGTVLQAHGAACWPFGLAAGLYFHANLPTSQPAASVASCTRVGGSCRQPQVLFLDGNYSH